jgi:hypothetical protein
MLNEIDCTNLLPFWSAFHETMQRDGAKVLAYINGDFARFRITWPDSYGADLCVTFQALDRCHILEDLGHFEAEKLILSHQKDLGKTAALSRHH